MTNLLTWAGSIAGALIALATVLRWTVHRAIRAGTWAVAAVRLPEVVDDLAQSVTDLSTSVERLSRSVETLHRPTFETL